MAAGCRTASTGSISTQSPVKCRSMARDWLLVETLGDEPAVVANGRQLRDLVPITAFLRRSPHIAAITTAVAETVETGQSLASITPKSDWVIRTEPVLMSDGRVHGVHVWSGPSKAEPPERPTPGPLIWDLTTGAVTDTPESLANSGVDPDAEPTRRRTVIEDVASRDLSPSEIKVLAMTVSAEPGRTLCSNLDVTDWQGNPIRVGFVARTVEETAGARTHLVARAMNWRSERDGPDVSADQLAQKVLAGLAQPGVHRALADVDNQTLLKWLDEPCPYFDWRAGHSEWTHPEDKPLQDSMTKDSADRETAGVLRMRGFDGGWVPIQMTVNRVELEGITSAGVVSFRLPTDAEIAEAGLAEAGSNTEAQEPKPRRKKKAAAPTD